MPPNGIRHKLMRCTPMRCMLMRYTPMRCTPMRCMPMRCMNREIFDLSLSIPRCTPGQGGVGPGCQNVPPHLSFEPEPETETDEAEYRQSADRGRVGGYASSECCRDTETELIVHTDQSPTVHSQFGNIWTRISNHHSLMLVREESCY